MQNCCRVMSECISVSNPFCMWYLHTFLDELQRITNNVEKGYHSALCDFQTKDLKKKMFKHQYTILVSIIRTNYITIT